MGRNTDKGKEMKTVTIHTKTHFSHYFNVIRLYFAFGMAVIKLKEKTIRIPLDTITKIVEL